MPIIFFCAWAHNIYAGFSRSWHKRRFIYLFIFFPPGFIEYSKMACLLGKKAVVDNLVVKIMHYQNQSLVFFQHKQGIRARPLAVKTAADKGDRNRIYFISTHTQLLSF